MKKTFQECQEQYDNMLPDDDQWDEEELDDHDDDDQDFDDYDDFRDDECAFERS